MVAQRSPPEELEVLLHPWWPVSVSLFPILLPVGNHWEPTGANGHWRALELSRELCRWRDEEAVSEVTIQTLLEAHVWPQKPAFPSSAQRKLS